MSMQKTLMADHGPGRSAISISFTNEIVKEEERKYLRTLPAHIKVEFQLNNDKLNLLLVHGSPRKINQYLFEDREEKSRLRIMQDADADVMCFGHTHKPYHRVLSQDDGKKGIIIFHRSYVISVSSYPVHTIVNKTAFLPFKINYYSRSVPILTSNFYLSSLRRANYSFG